MTRTINPNSSKRIATNPASYSFVLPIRIELISNAQKALALSIKLRENILEFTTCYSLTNCSTNNELEPNLISFFVRE